LFWPLAPVSISPFLVAFGQVSLPAYLPKLELTEVFVELPFSPVRFTIAVVQVIIVKLIVIKPWLQQLL